jgi:UDP-glucose 4-epimerase
MMGRALVTGGAGFIGSRLVRNLMAAGWQVGVLDDFSVGREDDLAFAGDAVHRVPGNVADARVVAAFVASWQPTVVFHLAALHFIPDCDRDPVRAIQTNVVGTMRVIDALAGRPDCRLVFASTGDVYKSGAAPHDESSPLGPGSLYGVTKVTGEQLVNSAVGQGVACRIARLFNVYGPGDRTAHVLPDIVNSLTQHGVLELGRMDPVRDYVYVDDVVQALVMLAGYDGSERVFNIGSGEGRSVRQLVDAVLEVHGVAVPVRTDPAKLRPVERPVLIADSRLARTVLGWSPQTPFRDGIERTVMAAAGRLSLHT